MALNKGLLIYWTITDFLTDAAKLESLGFGDLTPRNDFRSAMIKALHKYVKGNDKLYRTFNDNAKTVSFGVFVQSATEGDLDMNKEVIIKVDKLTGTASYDSKVLWDSSKIAADYEEAKTTLNSNQLRATVLRYVRENNGISMRPSGGIYFVDKQFEPKLAKLRELFRAFPGNTTLFEVPVYDDQGTLSALEEAISVSMVTQMEKLVEEINLGHTKGTLTKKQLQNRKEDADKIMNEIVLHSTNLRSRAEGLAKKAAAISEVLAVKIRVAEGSIEDSAEFGSLLRML